MAGGNPIDIGMHHGIHNKDVFKHVWKVLDAVNQCKELDFGFPDKHEDQQRIAAGFAKKFQVGFDNCVGCIDGILIWTEKPSRQVL